MCLPCNECVEIGSIVLYLRLIYCRQTATATTVKEYNLKRHFTAKHGDFGMSCWECSVARKSKVESWVTGQNGSGQNGMDKMVYGQNGIGQNGTDKMVWTKWYNFIFCVPFNSVEFNIYLVTKSHK